MKQASSINQSEASEDTKQKLWNTSQSSVQKSEFALNPINYDSDDEYSDPIMDEEEDLDDMLMKLPVVLPTSVTEAKLFVLPSDSFIQVQTEINIVSRLAIIDWLLRIVLKVKFQRGTLFNAVYILDRILATKPVSADSLQLTSIVCLWISAKVEEASNISSLPIFLTICQNQFTSEQFRTKELEIFGILNGRLNFPTSQLFIHPLLTAIDSESEFEAVQFFLDLSLMEFELICYPTPLIAVAAIAAAMGQKCPLKKLLSLISFDSSKDAIVAIKKLADAATFVLERKNTAMYSVYDEGWLQEMKDNVEKSVQFFCNNV
ncbi:cyclin A [Tritrichomonas foetus]|uniref:Cyclin A n=1 Tax=Tritrichomonas foetus TaxID=1144522 RepID=A0A1J4KLK0_9EUKA|nr:cyclin A [Tritrichomonas foetus]|eukprot:OHT12183.1 cyclin A [Tritrichomonas foetus]